MPFSAAPWARYMALAGLRIYHGRTLTACHAVSSWHTIEVSEGVPMTMLDRMRQHKNWLKWSLGLVVLSFVIFYIPEFLRSTGADAASGETVATVDGREITSGDFRRVYQAQ